MPNLRTISASHWTRFLLAALGLTLFALAICAFLAAVLNASGDTIGHRTFSAFNLGLASFVAIESIALLALIAIRLETTSTDGNSATATPR